MIIGSVYSILSLAIMYFFGMPLLTLFVEGSEVEILENAFLYLIINGLFSIPLAGVNIFRLLIQGMGYSKIAMFAGVCEMFARSLTALLLVPPFGFVAACFAGPIAWIMADMFLVPVYFMILRNIRRWGIA